MRGAIVDTVEYATIAKEVLRAHAPAAVSSWFENPINRYIADGSDVRDGLGLTKRARKRHILKQRDRHVVAALALCTGGPTASAEQLHKAIEAFRETWPAVRYIIVDEPPADWSELERMIFWIFRLSRTERVPGTPRALAQIYETNLKIANVDSTSPTNQTCVRSKTRVKRGHRRSNDRGKGESRVE